MFKRFINWMTGGLLHQMLQAGSRLEERVESHADRLNSIEVRLAVIQNNGVLARLAALEATPQVVNLTLRSGQGLPSHPKKGRRPRKASKTG
jgi:hypothetical protein